MTQHERNLTQAATRYRAAVTELESARGMLAGRVQAAARDGVRQVDILHATGNVWTREYVRKLTRKEGGR